MKILFIHQNFPGQFKYLAPALAAKDHQVTAMTMQATKSMEWLGIKIIQYKNSRGTSQNIHPWAKDFETKIIRAESAFNKAFGNEKGWIHA